MALITVTTSGQTVVVGDNDIVVIDIPGGGTVNIVADSGDNVDKIRIVFGDDSEADTVNIDLSTFSENGLEINLMQYDPTDSVNLIGAYNTNIDPSNVDELSFDYVGADNNVYSGHVQLKDGGEKDFTTDPPPIAICFAEGTIIDTDLGPTPIESLRIGDLVRTLDNDLQPIRWIGKKRLDSIDLARAPRLRPIVFAPSSMGYGVPAAPLTLSPQHRVMLSDWKAQLLLGSEDVFVEAHHLVDGQSITVNQTTSSVTYYHILLDRHELVTANGMLVETLYLGQISGAALDEGELSEIQELFPEHFAGNELQVSARPLTRGYEAKALFAMSA